MNSVETAVHEIRHEVRIDLTDALPMTNLAARTRTPVGLWLIYGLRRDVVRVDVVVQWHDGAERWTPAAGMPAWMRRIVDYYMPRDVDQPEAERPTGRDGFPVPIADGRGGEDA